MPPRPKVLIVDDSPTMASIAINILDKAGYDILHAHDAESGLDMARKVRPPMALVDVVLPGMDGIELCRALRADPATKDMKIIIMTTLNNSKEQAAAKEAGANAFLGKPLEKEILLHAINVVLLGM